MQQRPRIAADPVSAMPGQGSRNVRAAVLAGNAAVSGFCGAGAGQGLGPERLGFVGRAGRAAR
jgi:hypothetical protein